MKNRDKIFSLLAVVLITLSSCTNEGVPFTSVKLLKKVVDVATDGSSKTTLIAYKGNKIVNIDQVDQFATFYYTGDLITKVTKLEKSNRDINILQYVYTDGELIKVISSKNYVLNYIHHADGFVSYEKLTKDSNNLDVKVYHGTLYFQNGNLVKDEKTLDNAGTGIVSENRIEFSYDSKNNAMSNILGFSKLLDYSKVISLNNEIKSTVTQLIKSSVENWATSSINPNSSKYEYDKSDYPTEIVSENLLFGGNDTKHVKSQLFYD